ncbi:MAG: hypothetical protein L7S56_06260 [Candidatus Poseidonia sp.]|nr:hypothetical protein [Poseidonia sp.]
MDEWKPLTIEETGIDETAKLPAVNSEGFAGDASLLQAQFDGQSNHLSEVRERHTEILVTAGMLPETALHELEPERALAWVVESVNGRMNPDGLTLPLLGSSLENIHLHHRDTDEHTYVQLKINDGDLPALVREFPLPKEASATLQARFEAGRLHLRW